MKGTCSEHIAVLWEGKIKKTKEKAEIEVKSSGPEGGAAIAWAVLKEHLNKGWGTHHAQNRSCFKGNALFSSVKKGFMCAAIPDLQREAVQADGWGPGSQAGGHFQRQVLAPA